eukprot:9499024-Pyramimonas_sp.AAC.1
MLDGRHMIRVEKNEAERERHFFLARHCSYLHPRGTGTLSPMQDWTGRRGSDESADVFMRAVAVPRSCVTAHLHMYTRRHRYRTHET